ncbi:MAG: hypothetical protein DI585_05465 [Pseudomonas fluorescens]|nr:MAG: hypothetical protein DI585_05465 [Pseudomonas fluorescens]
MHNNLFRGRGLAVMLKDIHKRFFPLREDPNDNPHLNDLLLKLKDAEDDQSQSTEIRKKA